MSRQDSQPPIGRSADEDDDARSQRIAAMRELVGTDASTSIAPQSSPAIKPPARRKRRVPGLLVALTVIVVFASVVAAWQGWFPWQRGKPVTADTTISVNLADYDLHCPSAAVWSPDDKHIAVLAQLGACSNNDLGLIEPNVIAIFDIQGKLERLLYPDSVTLGKDAPTTPQPTPTVGATQPTTLPTHTQYWVMSYSPDGGRLALTYQVAPNPNQLPPAENAFENGIALLPLDGRTGEKLTAPLAAYGGVWDMQTRRLIPANVINQRSAFAYEWSQQGTLAPVTDSSASGPIGNPSGGQRFTIWQPGGVYFDREKHALDFTFVTMAWSPDGRYLAPYLGLGGELASGTSGITQHSDGSYQIPPRDTGLIIVASQLKSPADPYATLIPVAWRGDGRVIAAMAPNPLIDQITQRLDSTVIADATEHIIIYDCATGAKRLTLATKPIANQLQRASSVMAQPVLRWSSSGQKLMLLDAPFDSLTIWNVLLKY
jgi:hypothetical protein